ncbi:Uncharacterised protein [Mycobacteroides abscessus subsp. abscessus]|nr:Uncharacterised protein [Mycobacteroides abscessus subsp. abscessus]
MIASSPRAVASMPVRMPNVEARSALKAGRHWASPSLMTNTPRGLATVSSGSPSEPRPRFRTLATVMTKVPSAVVYGSP